MKAKIIWIAVHPQDSTCTDVQLEEPHENGVFLQPYIGGVHEEYILYKRYACIEIED